MASDLLALLGMGATAKTKMDSAALEGQQLKRDREQTDLLARIKMDAEAEDRANQQRLQGLQERNLLDLIRERNETPAGPARAPVYDPMRGAIIDPGTGNVTIPKDLPARPEPQGPQGSPQLMTDKDTGQPVFFNPTTGTSMRPPANLAVGGDRQTMQVRQAIASNAAQLDAIDQALLELEKNPQAVGLKRSLGIIPGLGGLEDVVNQRVDPAGNAARMFIANVGSLKVHDRSGAAVTVSEFPRLKPFIPSNSDTPEAAKLKLNGLRRELLVITEALQQGALIQDVMNGGTGSASPATPPAASPAAPVDVNRFMPPRRP